MMTLKNKVEADYQNLAYSYLGHIDNKVIEKYKNSDQEAIDQLWNTLKDNWIKKVLSYLQNLFNEKNSMPIISAKELPRATSVFEYMNKGGTPLDTFDIMVAKFAEPGVEDTLYDIFYETLSSSIQLPESIERDKKKASSYYVNLKKNGFGLETSSGVLVKSMKDQFLNLLSISSFLLEKEFDKLDVSIIKKEAILSIKPEVISDDNVKKVVVGMKRAIAFLQYRCGIHVYDYLRYKLMVLPIALFLADDKIWENKNAINILEYWYWASIFSGVYREKQNVRIIQDIKSLYNWIFKEKESKKIKDRINYIFKSTNYNDENTLLLENEERSVGKAVECSILSYIVRQEPHDLNQKDEFRLSARVISEEEISLYEHIIIPLGNSASLDASAKSIRKRKGHILNSPLNKTLISIKASKSIKNLSVFDYLKFLDDQAALTHFIPAPPNRTEIQDNDSEAYRSFLISRLKLLSRDIRKHLESLI